MSQRGGRKRKNQPRTRGGKKAATSIGCTMIQWQRTEPPTGPTGKPICPQCGAPAEQVLGLFGQPCWAHKRTRRTA